MSTQQRLGLGLLGAPDALQMVDLAVLAEQKGFESVWIAETRLTRDGIAPCAAIAMATNRIKIGTGIVNVFTRGAVLTAVSFVSLDEVSQGRIIMGLGTGSPLILQPQGVEFRLPLTRLRETIDIVQPLIRGEAVTYSGKTMRVNGAKLEIQALRQHIPLYLGVTGPKALELCGEKADGVMLNAFLPTAYTKRAIDHVAIGAKRAGRNIADIDITGAVSVSVDNDSKVAKDRGRLFIAMYLSLFPNISQETGLHDDIVLPTRAAFNEGGAEAAAQHIGDDIVDHLMAAGTPDECLQRINAYREAGLQQPILFPLEPNIRMAVETLAA